MRPLWQYSALSTAVIVVTGGMAAAGAATGSPVLGVYERLTIGSFMLWMLVLALAMVPRDRPLESGLRSSFPWPSQSVQVDG